MQRSSLTCVSFSIKHVNHGAKGITPHQATFLYGKMAWVEILMIVATLPFNSGKKS